MARRKLTIQEAQERFDTITEGAVLYSKDRAKHIVFSRKTDEWRMAYTENKTRAHSQLPKHWFVSKHGEIVTVANREIQCINPSLSDPHNPSMSYLITGFDVAGVGHYTGGVHQIVALVWDAPMIGDSEEKLNALGLWAFGREIGSLQAHHRNFNRQDNYYKNLEINVRIVHEEEDAGDFGAVIKYLSELSPEEAYIIVDGSESYDRKTGKAIDGTRYVSINNLTEADLAVVQSHIILHPVEVDKKAVEKAKTEIISVNI